MNARDAEMRKRIEDLVESVRDDHTRSHQLFQYVWSMMCVRRGLMRVLREITTIDGRVQLLLEEVKTGQRRLVSRPDDLDLEIEGLAVQALARILATQSRAG